MRRCLQLAACGRQNAKPNPTVGAVIVCRGRIIGEGYHVRCGEGHAEVNAFASVRPEDEALLADSTMYVSLEPCSHYGKTPPCADLIVSKGVKRVVVGCIDPFAKVQGRGIARLRNAGIAVAAGVRGRLSAPPPPIHHVQHPPAPVHTAEMGTVGRRLHRRPRRCRTLLHTVHHHAHAPSALRVRRHTGGTCHRRTRTSATRRA